MGNSNSSNQQPRQSADDDEQDNVDEGIVVRTVEIQRDDMDGADPTAPAFEVAYIVPESLIFPPAPAPEVAPKKKVGRPAKNKNTKKEIPSSSTTPIAKRGRGRPPKKNKTEEKKMSN